MTDNWRPNDYYNIEPTTAYRKDRTGCLVRACCDATEVDTLLSEPITQANPIRTLAVLDVHGLSKVSIQILAMETGAVTNHITGFQILGYHTPAWELNHLTVNANTILSIAASGASATPPARTIVGPMPLGHAERLRIHLDLPGPFWTLWVQSTTNDIAVPGRFFRCTTEWSASP